MARFLGSIQTKEMNQQLKILIQLSHLDARMEVISTRLQEIPNRLGDQHSQNQSLKENIEQIRNSIDELTARRRKAERDIENSQNLLDRYKKQALEVKTNREYSAIMSEIDSTQEKISELEEEFLLSLDAIEENTTRLSSLEKELDESRPQMMELEKTLSAEQVSLEDESEELDENRRGLTTQLDPTTLSRYEKTQNHSNGSAVVQVEGGICRGCFVNLPPQLVSKVHIGEELQRCPNCARFLYAPSQEEAGESEAGSTKDNGD